MEPEPDTCLEPGEWLLYVNYFGVMDRAVERVQRRFDERVIIDDTQAFFHRPRAGVWAFSSARKFFGVPDGAYLYGEDVIRGQESLPDSLASAEHLVNRLAGSLEVAYRQFQANESAFDAEPRRPSDVSRRLLDSIDYGHVARARRDNFAHLHQRLQGLNRLAPALPSAAVPLCYPLLLASAVDRSPLHERGLFVPTYWPELTHRSDPGYAFERSLAGRLLPLPIDQRYGARELDHMLAQLEDVLASAAPC